MTPAILGFLMRDPYVSCEYATLTAGSMLLPSCPHGMNVHPLGHVHYQIHVGVVVVVRTARDLSALGISVV